MTDTLERPSAATADAIRIPGGTFRMGSDRHYPEEKPAHSVTVGDFWIDPTPVTNAQFRTFIQATGYVTWAEIDPDPRDYPGARPEMLKAGGLVFTPTIISLYELALALDAKPIDLLRPLRKLATSPSARTNKYVWHVVPIAWRTNKFSTSS